MTNQQGAPEALRVEAAYGGDGKFIGYRLLSSGAPGGLLVWADQTVMSGFRIGDHFVPDYQEVIEYKPVSLVEAQQPAPSAAAAATEGHGRTDAEIVAQTVELTEYLLSWKWGLEPEGDTSRIWESKNTKALVCWNAACHIQDLLTQTDVWNAVAELDGQPSPTPQADSAPATSDLITIRKPTTRAEVEWLVKLAHLLVGDVNEQLQRVLDGADVPQADSQPAPGLDIAVMQLAESVGLIGPASRVGDLHAAIQRFHDLICVNATIKAAVMAADAIRGAARAPADSVTAPAGGEIDRLRAQVKSLTRDCGRQASKIAELIADLKFQDGKHREDRAQLQTIYEHQRGECWYWQGDGQDHLESLCNTLPVVIRADQLRALVSTPPAQAADSVTAPAAYSGNLEQELAMLIRRIVSSARRNCEDGSNVLKLANEAWAYLVRKGLNGSPLRDAGIESDPTPPAQAADSVLEDAALLKARHDFLLWNRSLQPSPIESSVEYSVFDKALELYDAARKQGANQ